MTDTDKEESFKNKKSINKTERWTLNNQPSKSRTNFDNSQMKYPIDGSVTNTQNKLNNKYKITNRQMNMEGIVKPVNKDDESMSYYDLRSYVINFFKDLKGPFISKGYELHREDLLILLTKSWLNDKIINCYLELLQDYDKNIYVFSTYFYTNLRNNGLSRVIKYTAKMDIFQYKYLFFPVHLDSHWVLVCLDVKKGILEYRDSFVKYNKKVMDDIEEYLLYERMRLYKEKTVFSKFSITSVDVQYNGYDCGVFVLMYAKYKLKSITKFKKDMRYYRKKILYEIFNNQIVYEEDEREKTG